MSRTRSSPANVQRRPVVNLPPLWREIGQCVLLSGLTVALFSWISPPYALPLLAFVCLAPWLLSVLTIRRAWLVHWSSFVFGWLLFLINLRWLMPVTGLGYAALAFYLAIYWPLTAWAVRTGRRHGIAPLWSFPIIWVACEYLRAWLMSGFPWLFLAHSLYSQSWLIQISDLVGAYGVSFLLALVNAVVVGLILMRRPAAAGEQRESPRQVWAGVATAAVLLVATLAYGSYRCGQQTFTPGPRIAVVQHDFPLESKPPYGERAHVIFGKYVQLAVEAAAERPDLLVFPETVWGATQNIDFLSVDRGAVEDTWVGAWQYGRLCHEAVSAFARGDYAVVNGVLEELERRYGGRLPRLPNTAGPAVTVVLGATSLETFPEATYPQHKRYNSALLYDDTGRQLPIRYDKMHLVPFGEFVPFRGGRLHWLYRWLNRLSPFSEGGTIDYSLWPGDEPTVFELSGPDGTTRFGTPICYEDVMPYVIRDFVWAERTRRVDFLVNISNDGWFVYGNELPQHLAICAFRAVENRVPIARAVNTGISGFIDPNGRIYSVVERDGRRYGRGVIGYRVDRVLLDERGSFYGRTGDWFARICLVLTGALWIVAIVERWVLALQQRIAAWRAKGERNDASA